MTEAAAHAAAMQAFRSAMQQEDDNNRAEYNSEHEINEGHSMMLEMNGGNSSTTHSDFYNSQQLHGFHSSQAFGFDASQVELLNELMEYQQQSARIQSPDDATAHELLQLLERQQQEQIVREEASIRAQRESRNRRPEKHYLTIANNGKGLFSFMNASKDFTLFSFIKIDFCRYIVGSYTNRNWFPTRSTFVNFDL
jgi:hypothetical protein